MHQKQICRWPLTRGHGGEVEAGELSDLWVELQKEGEGLADAAGSTEHRDLEATLLLGQARGACLAALVHQQLSVAEYTALQMKKAIAGHGKAAKAQVQEMVKRLLNLPGLPGSDAADALGLAITHAHAARSMALMQDAGMGRAKSSGMLRGGRGG